MQLNLDRNLVLFLTLTTPVAAQRSERVAAPTQEPNLTPPVTAPVRLPGGSVPTAENRNVFAGAPVALPVAYDDAVPRASTIVAEPGAHGDTFVSSTDDDPNYLGFVGGRYYPPADERLDPELVARASTLLAQGKSEVHGFVMFAARMTRERFAVLESLGVRVLGQHPYYTVKAAMPIAALDTLAGLDFVRWVGVARAPQKLHPNLSLAPIADDGRIDVYVDVFESDLGRDSTSTPFGSVSRSDAGKITSVDDPSLLPLRVQSNGPAHAALVAAGAEIIEYIDNLRAFRARVLPGQIEALTALDFVQFVEPDIAPTLAHDESTPMIGNDLVRAYTGGNNSGLIAIGQADSGYDTGHGALSLYTWAWDFTGSGGFADGCEHGTHTLGTILGNGFNSYGGSLKGVAPGLARSSGATRAYVARIFNNSCASSGAAVSSILSVNRSGYWDGVNWSLKPVAINNSWGSPGIGWVGSEADARTIDDEVYNQDQLYVWAAGNEGSFGSQTCRLQATAKNALTVGAVVDWYDSGSGYPGAVASFSSRGPCGDGRWKPNVAAPGSWIKSCDANSNSGYRLDQGTSMAAPHITGVAAQVADWNTWLRYEPAALASVLMSSAETKSGAALTTATDQHLRNYGAGRVEEHKAVLGSSDYYWNTWAFDAPWPNWQHADFNVPAGTKRMTICMNYYEPASSAGASQALVNNYDLYIDDPFNGIDGNGNTGEYYAQQSTRDNCEIRTIENPTVGWWRWKAWPQNVAWFSNVKMGVTVTFELDTAQCSPFFDVSSSAFYLQPNQAANIETYVANYEGLASGVSLDTYSGANLSGVYTTLWDGSQANLAGNVANGAQIELGDMPPQTGRVANFYASWPTEGYKTFSAYCDIDNFGTYLDWVPFIVDGTPPPLPTGFGSTTHTVGAWSQNTSISLAWTSAGDPTSGLAGYAFASGSGAAPDPGYAINLGNSVTSQVVTAPSSGAGFYVSLRPVDNCNNWNGNIAWAGPFLVDAVAPSGPTNLSSTSHSVAVTSCDTTVDVAFTPASDSASNLAGYMVVWDHAPSTVPTGALNLAANSSSTTSPVLGTGVWYVHLRARDNASNYGTTQHLGPFSIQPGGIVGQYCSAKVNSLGCLPHLSPSGTPSATLSSGFTIACSNVLNQKSGQLIYSLNGRASVPFQGGTLCIASPIRRTVIVNSGGSASGNDCTGAFSLDFNAFARGTMATVPAPELSVPGTVVDAQWWGRDPGFTTPNNTSLSAGLEFVMCN